MTRCSIAGRVARHFEVDNFGSDHRDVEGRDIQEFVEQDDINGLDIGEVSIRKRISSKTFVFADRSRLVSDKGLLRVI